ncbi:DUF3352 domain-containing protein [Nodularia sphaerocarpa]|uniref:DUF3352 domain-containing protein n=1 Tax=Nodularia sphaerocarpa TaxID=137816 RepID=UPI001EFBF8F8|nr:DUF3352 domain-containing protein [Nodularia sphaerocarpa]MDB9372560.1 DUF3352 domain-containing protein [Nodularia sphaerocarpa CS-585]MDB9376907.1 DUF3352 domain-containing protein [Nodularia sphaerocarpa CS-585A2]ULP73691.1 hypothetical protein BDGGKGIB_03350 [Nodularia sphaerocarpa UHCC 0038]
MPERKANLLIPAVGAAVLVVGTVAAYRYFQGPSGDSSGALGSAKLVPSTAVMATYITTDPQAWAKLSEFGTPEAQKLVAKGLEDFQPNFLNAGNISYEQDLKPWVGGVMVAVLPPNATNSATNVQPESNILMVVGIKDKLKALNFTNKFKSQKGVKVEEYDYKGEKITAVTENGKLTYSAVLNNNHLVLAQSKPSVEKAIETSKGQPSFASKEAAKTILTTNADVKNILAQVYIPDYGVMMQQLVATSPQARQLPPQTLKQFQQVKSIVARVGVDDQGVRMRAIANLDPQLNKFEYKASPAKIVSQLPVDTFALMTGNGINRSWSSIVEQSQDDPAFNQILQQVRGQLKFVNIDLDKDVFGWMDREFAFGAVPSNQGVLANLGVGGAILLETSDRQTATATLSKLDNLAKIQQINVAKRNIDGKDVTEWQIPGQGALLSHGWLNQDTVFLTLGGSVAEAIATNNTPKLDSSDTFKAVTNSLKKPNAGYFYIDAEKTASLVNRFITQGQPLPSEANTVLSAIHGFGVTATSPDKSTGQLEMLLALKPKTTK